MGGKMREAERERYQNKIIRIKVQAGSPGQACQADSDTDTPKSGEGKVGKRPLNLTECHIRRSNSKLQDSV